MKVFYFYITWCLLILHKVISEESKETCYSIKKGAHSPALISFNGLNSKQVLFTWAKFDKSSSRYLFSPSDTSGHLCSVSWNKLFGAARCGVINSHHKDSDRFVWRRDSSCLIFSDKYVLGEKSDCVAEDLIEIAAYTYDNGAKPFENQGRLLKEFKTRVRVEEWYGYKITIEKKFSLYELLDSEGNLLESIRVDHRDCGIFYKDGGLLGFYFGGQCPAPQQVDVCYK